MKTFVSPEDLANARTKSIKEQQQSELPSVANRLNTAISRFNTNRNNLFTDQSARVTEMNDPRYGYNPYQGYRSDSAEWKESVDKRTADIENDANTIRNILDEYEPYFDAEWVKNIREGLESTSGSLSEITKFAQSTDEYSQNLNNIADLRNKDSEVREAASNTYYDRNQSEINATFEEFHQKLSGDTIRKHMSSNRNIIDDYMAVQPTEANLRKSYMVDDTWEPSTKLRFYQVLKNGTLEDALNFIDDYKYAKQNQKFAEFGEKYPILGALASVPLSLLGGAEYIGNTINKAVGADPNLSRSMAADWTSSIIEGGTQSDLVGGSKTGAFLYNTGTSMLQSLAAAPLGPLGLVLLGGSAAASTTNDLIDRGASDAQVLLGGLAAGVFEGLFERFSIKNLKSLKEVSPKTVKDVLGNTAKSMGVNFTEELFTETANVFYDLIANGDISNFELLTKKYLEENPNASEKDAKRYAATELGIQIAEAGISGALMGSALGGVFSTVNYVKRSGAIKRTFGNNPKALISIANSINNDAEVKRLAELVRSELIDTGKVTGKSLNALYAAIESHDFQLIEKAVANRLASLGESEYEEVAAAITKKMQGVELSKAEQTLLKESKFAEQVQKELDPKNNGTGNAESWVKNIGTSVVNADVYNKNRATPTTTDALVEAAPNLANITAANPSADVMKDSIAKSSGVERLSEGQKTLRKIGQSFGARVEFADLDYTVTDENGNQKVVSPEGSYNRDTNTITLNTNVKDNHRPVLFVLKHELTHSLEKAEDLFALLSRDIQSSDVFNNYVKSRVNPTTGKKFESAEDWASYIIKDAKTKGRYLGTDPRLGARREMVADFVGDKLFGGRDADIEELLNSLQPQIQKTFVEKVKEFFANLKARFKGKTELTEIEALEKRFLEVANKVSEINKTEQVGERGSAEDSKIDNVKHSLPAADSAYLEAVERGDMDTAQRLVDEAAKENGYTIHSYHGTRDKNFTEFKKEFIGSRFSFDDKGFFFIDRKSIADDYAHSDFNANAYGRILDVYLKVKKPLLVNKSFCLKEGLGNPFRDDDAIGVWDAYSEYFKEEAENHNADGIILDDGMSKMTVVFDPNQIKSADPVTYDDNGNIIPLSERFKSDNNDIRYSLPPDAANVSDILNRVKSGEITVSEAEELLKKRKTLNLSEIANLPKEAADTTPSLNAPKREGSGDKESKLYGSLLGAEIVTDEVKAEIANDTFIKNYEGTTNKTTLQKALKELEEGGRDRVLEFESLKDNPDKASKIDIAIGFILLERYQREGMTTDALNVAEVLRAIATASGQAVQMFSILGRFTPEMMVEYAKKELKQAFEIFAKNKTQKWIDANIEKYQLTDEDIEVIRRNTLEAANLQDGSRTKAILLGEIATRLQDKLPATVGDKIRTLQRISLLLNLKTNLRNFVGNASMVLPHISSDLFGSIIDAKLSKITGQRSVGIINIAESAKGFKKGYAETLDDFKRGIRTKQEEINRFENKRSGKSFRTDHDMKALNEISKFLNRLDSYTSLFLELGDRPFFEMWFMNSLNNQMRLNKVDIPTKEMLEVAQLEAEQRTWQDNNKVTRSISKIKSVLNHARIPGTDYGLGDFVLKFVKTPSNIAKAMVEFSPVGIIPAIKSGIEFKRALDKGQLTLQMQRQLSRTTGNAIMGTMIYVLVAILANAGALKLKGKGDEDKDVSNFEKYVAGIPPYSMELFGKNVTYTWNQPIGTTLAIIADIIENKEENKKLPWYEQAFEAFKTAGVVFTEQSFLQGLHDFFAADDLVSSFIEALASEPAAFVPQVLSQIASITDPYSRVTYDPNSVMKTMLNNIILKIPGLRKTLPERVNVLGESSENVQYKNIWKAFAAPGNTYPESLGEVADEVYGLYKTTADATVIPPVAPNYVEIRDHRYNFTVEQKNKYQRNMGQTSSAIISELLELDSYNDLTDEQKVKVLQSVYGFSTAYAKARIGLDYETLSALIGENKDKTPILSEETYNKLDEKAITLLAEEELLTKKEYAYKGDYKKLAEYYVKRAKE